MENTPRFVLVYRKTRLEELIERFNTIQQAKFYVEQSGSSFYDYELEHALYEVRVEHSRKTLVAAGRVQKLERSLLPSYQFNADDIVVVIGQDGLVANTLKYLKGNSVIALNPDRKRWDGVLLPFVSEDLPLVLSDVLAGRREHKAVALAEATTNDGQRMLAVNDLFIGPKTHTSARYIICWGEQSESQSSSGIIVSTGLGSTGWLQSLLAMAKGISGQNSVPLEGSGFAWDSPQLIYTVREPFPSQQTGTTLVTGTVDAQQTLKIESLMPENGVIFSDGIESDFLAFNTGCSVQIGIAPLQGRLVV